MEPPRWGSQAEPGREGRPGRGSPLPEEQTKRASSCPFEVFPILNFWAALVPTDNLPGSEASNFPLGPYPRGVQQSAECRLLIGQPFPGPAPRSLVHAGELEANGLPASLQGP